MFSTNRNTIPGLIFRSYQVGLYVASVWKKRFLHVHSQFMRLFAKLSRYTFYCPSRIIIDVYYGYPIIALQLLAQYGGAVPLVDDLGVLRGNFSASDIKGYAMLFC